LLQVDPGREAFQQASDITPKVAAVWLRHLSSFDEAQVMSVVDRLPPEAATDTARAFAKAVLASNRKFLLSLPR